MRSLANLLEGPVHIGVFEYLRGGGLIDTPVDVIPESLLREGSWMLEGLVEDIARIPHATVHVPLDPRISVDRDQYLHQAHSHVKLHEVQSSRWLEEWNRIAGHCDIVFLIAPEFEGILRRAVARLRSSGVIVLGCDDPFLEATSDKWLTYQHWRREGVPVVETVRASEVTTRADLEGLRTRSPQPTTGWTVKRVMGAGCEGHVFFGELSSVYDWLYSLGDRWDWIVQPWIEGEAASVSILCGPTLCVLPPSRQRLTIESSQVAYCGGDLPWSGLTKREMEQWVLKWIRAMPGTPLGWIGIDFVMPYGSAEPVVIEINPRMTTSYVGLRNYLEGNLAEGLIQIAQGKRWHPTSCGNPIRFGLVE